MSYWESRKHLQYYRYIESLLASKSGDSIIDVGGHDTPMVLSGQFKKRVVLSLWPLDVDKRFPSVEYRIEDFMSASVEKFDFVMCLQTLEHIVDVEAFTSKLFEISTGKVLISVPYQWPKGLEREHVQDPVTMEKVESWTGLKPTISHVVDSESRFPRLVCYYDN